MNGHRHPLPERLPGIVHHHAEAVDQVGAELGRLHRLGGELRGGRDEADAAGARLVRCAVGDDGHLLSGTEQAELRLAHVGAHPDRPGEGEHVDHVRRREDGSGLLDPGKDDAVRGREELGVVEGGLGGGKPGPGSGEVGLGVGDVLLPRSLFEQAEGLARLGHPGVGAVTRSAGVVVSLLGDGAGGHELLGAGEGAAGVLGGGGGVGQGSPRLVDLRLARALDQLVHGGLLCRDLRFGGVEVVLIGTGVELGENHAGVDGLPFLEVQLPEPARDAEPELDLADVDVAVEGEVAAVLPVGDGADDQPGPDADHENGDDGDRDSLAGAHRFLRGRAGFGRTRPWKRASR